MARKLIKPATPADIPADLNSAEEQISRVVIPTESVELVHCDACRGLQTKEDKKPLEEQGPITCDHKPVLTYKAALSPNLVVRKAVLNDLKMLFILLVNETVKLSGDPLIAGDDFASWYERNYSYLVMAGNKGNVQTMTIELLSKFANFPMSKIVDNIDPDPLVMQTFKFVTIWLDAVAGKSGASQAKNA
jgi:hypothetical protein